MRELKTEEMKEINGGVNTVVLGEVISAVIAFISGLLYGYSNPKKCS